MIRMLHSVKVSLARLMTSKKVGNFIHFLQGNRTRQFGCDLMIPVPEIAPEVRAMLFWGLYEKAEVNFIKKYLNSEYPVIELGGSIGVVSSVLGKILDGQKLVVVEANPKLIPLVEGNLELNGIANAHVVEAAIGNGSFLFFLEGDNNTSGKLIDSDMSGVSTRVQTLSLASIRELHNITYFSLVCDIEGSETEILFQDTASLDGCRNLIMEMHKTERHGKVYSIEDLITQVKKLGFEIKAQNGPVIFAVKR